MLTLKEEIKSLKKGENVNEETAWFLQERQKLSTYWLIHFEPPVHGFRWLYDFYIM